MIGEINHAPFQSMEFQIETTFFFILPFERETAVVLFFFGNSMARIISLQRSFFSVRRSMNQGRPTGSPSRKQKPKQNTRAHSQTKRRITDRLATLNQTAHGSTGEDSFQDHIAKKNTNKHHPIAYHNR